MGHSATGPILGQDMATPRDGAMRADDGRREAGRLRGAVVGSLGIVLALALYRPWEARPFDVLDFSEFLPLLSDDRSIGRSFLALAEYYVHDQGRLNVIGYAGIAVKWALFGLDTAGWQFGRFVLMCGVVVGMFMLLRVLGASLRAATAGSALFIVGPVAAPAWVRLTMGEPLGVAFLVGAALVACRYQHVSHWRLAGVVIAALCTCALLCKEMLGFALPLVLMLAWCHTGSGRFALPRASSRNLWVGGLVAAGAVAIAVVVLAVAASAASGSIASDYGKVELSLIQYIYSICVVLIPVWPLLYGWSLGGAYAYLTVAGAYLIVLQVGLGLVRRTMGAAQLVMLLTIGLSSTLLGTLLYMPWPYFLAFYGLPMLVGTALLLAWSLTAIERSAGWKAWLAYGVVVVLLLNGAVESHRHARQTWARQRVNYELARVLPHEADVGAIYFAASNKTAQPWMGAGPTLRRYALAIGAEALPPAADAPCETVARWTARELSGAMVISNLHGCGPLRQANYRFRSHFRYWEWPLLRSRRDSAGADVLLPRPEDISHATGTALPSVFLAR
jgi:hypothetical protein